LQGKKVLVVVLYPSIVLQGFMEWQADHVVGFIKALRKMFSEVRA
jgi:hypothetical protein